jgi:Bacterial regulatory proteins, luxR family
MVRSELARHSSRWIYAPHALALMAQGYSNAAIAAMLVATEATVVKHIRNIFDKLNLPESHDQHRGVLAVLTYLQEENRLETLRSGDGPRAAQWARSRGRAGQRPQWSAAWLRGHLGRVS